MNTNPIVQRVHLITRVRTAAFRHACLVLGDETFCPPLANLAEGALAEWRLTHDEQLSAARLEHQSACDALWLHVSAYVVDDSIDFLSLIPINT